MSTRQYLLNASIKHQVFMLRYAGSVFKQMSYFINQATKSIVDRLSKANTTLSKQRLNTLLQELTLLNNTIYKNMGKSVKLQMADLVKYEADFTKRLLNAATVSNLNTTVPTTTQLNAAAFTNVMNAVPGFRPVDGNTIGDALTYFGDAKAADVVQRVRVGFATGQTIDEIALGITKIQSSLVERQARVLARTITNHVASQARLAFYEENKDVLQEKYQVVATLDDRTCETCGALDGEVFDADEFEAPPYHDNCRCSFIALVDPEYDAGKDVDGGRPAQTEDGYEEVSSKTTYNSWINKQPAAFQDEILGPNKGALLRAGASMDKFVDHNYKPYTLKELRAMDDLHVFFNKAGL